MSQKFSMFAESLHQHNHASAADVAEIFGRLIINDLLDNDLSEHMAREWGTHAGHYASLALTQREAWEGAAV